MKNYQFTPSFIKILPILIAFLFTNVLLAQFSNESFASNDKDEIQLNVTPDLDESPTFMQEDKKARSSFKVFAGATFNNLDTSVDLESNVKTGFLLGASYKRGKFFYYEIGARYNHRVFGLNDDVDALESNSFVMSAIDIPISGGINLTSYIDKLIGVRIFISAVPSFVIGVENDNTSGIDKDDVNSFIMTGQAGIGIDIAFFFIEAGFNYGFTDTLKEYDSKPTQAFAGIGFRF